MASTRRRRAASSWRRGSTGSRARTRRRKAPRLAVTATLPEPELVEGEPEEEPETGPLRRCVVTRESRPKAEMLRFVLDPGRNLVADLQGKLPGRGMWLSARADVLERAV